MILCWLQASRSVSVLKPAGGVAPYDLAAIVDPVGGGIGGAREIDRGETAANVENTMHGQN